MHIIQKKMDNIEATNPILEIKCLNFVLRKDCFSLLTVK